MNIKSYSMGLKYKLPALFSILPLTAMYSNAVHDEEKTNFILILVDDIGYNDIECYNSRASGIATPNINQLAQNGIRFTDWQSAHSISGPSRASILTGRYPSRCGYPVSSSENAPMHYEHLGLPQDEVTLPEILKPLGYYTVALGKWHLGENPRFRPLRHGFDEYFGCLHNFPVGVVPQDIYEGDSIIGQEIYENIHDKLTDRAIQTMATAREKKQPFFIYLAHYLAHGPWEPRREFANDEEWQARQQFQGRMNQIVFPAMVRELDWQVGKLMSALSALGLEKNTVIIFVSDNGPWLTNDTLRSAGSAWPLRGSKFNTFEGGHRVPAIVSWPFAIRKGMVCDAPVSSMDILPTIAAIAGAPLPDRIIDGRDISTLLKGENMTELTERELLYYHATNLQAIRVGDWKLHLPRQPDHTHFMGRRNVGRGTIDSLNKPMLFNLGSDIEESQDLAEENPEIVIQLLRLAEEKRRELGDWDITGYNEHELSVPKDSIIKRPGRNQP
ncbi:MAG: sulfatase-like hydrolase/transferase [Bacteroidales bacterium]|nr:sulfatase-like hydrolase/transferase [Bacteroidales bacterium]